jgi:phospholipid/cholesterol/gamma-HCH transport system substrate-binding protein
MITRRTLINLVVFLGLALMLVWAGATQFVLQPGGGRTVTFDFVDATGLAPRNDVTMRGVPAGHVTEVTLTSRGVVAVEVRLDAGQAVTGGTRAEITRRSPIGDLTLDLIPGPGPLLPDGARIGLRYTSSPPNPERTIEILAQILHAIPSEEVGTLVSELATGLRGRGEDLGTLSRASADLPERILEVRAQLESLIQTGPKVTGVLAGNAEALADDITRTAELADILRDRRYDLLALQRSGASFAQVAGGLLRDEKANLACLVSDFGDVNTVLAGDLAELEGVLDHNHFFFDAVWISVQKSKDKALDWFRVHVLEPQEQHGESYVPRRRPPGVYGGHSCQTRYGPGVGPATQPDGVYLAPGSKMHPGR